MSVGNRIYLQRNLPSKELIEAFRKIPAAVIGDCMGRNCALHCSIHLMSNPSRNLCGPALTIQSARLALIPTPGEEEVLCWEYTCQTDEGRRCMVYVNGQTGTEEKILLLIEDESGTLVQ